MTTDDPRWRAFPVLRELHDQWWRARGNRLGESTRPFSRDWDQLLDDAGLISAEDRGEAQRDAKTLAGSDLVRLRCPRFRPHLIERILIPVEAEQRLAGLFGDPLASDRDTVDLATIPWEPELLFLREERVNVATQDLLAMNQFLAEHSRNRPTVPIKERSLEIFGDEKRLDALAVTALFRPGRLTLAHLRCRLVMEPLGWRRGPGPGQPVIVLENAATWDTYCRWNERSAQFSAVIYGKGMVFAEAVAGLSEIFRELGGIQPILYFGDLDPPGLEIPWRANRRAEAAGLPPVTPHAWSYQRLFELGAGREGTWEGDAVGEEALQWLGESSPPARRLFDRRRRLAQEHLSWEFLSAQPTS